MGNLIEQLQTRFPLLKELEVGCSGRTQGDALPAFVGLFLAAMSAAGPAACCFILPRKDQVGKLVSVLYALSSVKRDFAKFLSDSDSQFNCGDFVRVQPGKGVFRFLGVYPEYPTLFRLLCSCGSERAFPRALVKRMVAASGPRITGKFRGSLVNVQKPPIDFMLEMESCGNLGFAHTYTIVLDTQSHFKEFAENTLLTRTRNRADSFRVADLEILSCVNDDGSVEGQVAGSLGSPLVAITSSIDSLVAAALSHSIRRPTVLINDLHLLKSPQHFDTIAEKCNLVLLAAHTELETVNNLAKRQFPYGKLKIWRLGKNEVQIGQDVSHNRDGHAGLFRDVFAASLNLQPKLTHRGSLRAPCGPA